MLIHTRLSGNSVCFIVVCTVVVVCTDSENGGNNLLRKIGNYLSINTASYPRIFELNHHQY